MNDKNGIEICCANCCDIECGGKGACRGLKFMPSTDALESRIDDLQSQYGYAKKALALYTEKPKSCKPRAKRLVWVDELMKTPEYSEAKLGGFMFKVEKMLRFEFWQYAIYIVKDKVSLRRLRRLGRRQKQGTKLA